MEYYYIMLDKSKKIFKRHKRIKIRLKKKPQNPFNSTTIESIINRKDYPNYELYIHDDYMTLKNVDLEKFEELKLIIDDKLWIEIYLCFDFIKFIKKKDEDE